MLKKAIILSLALGLGMALAPMVSSAASKQPVLQAQATMIDDTAIDSTNTNSDSDNAISSDNDGATSNDDSNDDSLSSDATE